MGRVWIEEMKKEYLENVLTLLTVVILIDDKVYPEEVDTFSKAAQRISEQIDPNILFTNSMAADWFKANRANVNLKLKQDGAMTVVNGIIRNLREFAGHKDVFFNMIRIAHSDDEYHKAEHEVIKTASEIWQISYSVDHANIAG